MKTSSKAHMSKEEELARKLLKFYNFSIKKSAYYGYMAKPTERSVKWSDNVYIIYDDWKGLLFGDKYGLYSLNYFIDVMALYWKPYADRLPLLLSYKSLDELDILLTLAGAN